MHRALHVVLPALLAASPLAAQSPARADTTVIFEAFAAGAPAPGAAHLAAGPENAQVMRDSASVWLQTTEGTTFTVTLPRALPDSFVVEATLWADQATPINAEFGSQGVWRCGMDGVMIDSNGHDQQENFPNAEHHSPEAVRCRLVVNGAVAEGWIGDRKLLSVNGVAFGHGRTIEIRVPGGEQPSRFSALRVYTVRAGGAAAGSGRAAAF